MKTIHKSIMVAAIVSLLWLPVVSAQSVAGLKTNFPKSYGSWILSDSIRTFNGDNLYDYIDGGADNYLSSNFIDLLVSTYNKDDKYITVEIYRHQSPLYAFGIYSQERPLRGAFSKIGAQGYHEKGMINFLCGQYYVKLSTHDESSEADITMTKIATDLAPKLDPEGKMPGILDYFPEKDKIENSESLISTNFLGYEFLNSALIASYGKDDKTFKVFLIGNESPVAAKNMLTKYMEATKTSFTGTEGQFTINDPHNGKILLEWKGKYIWGIINEKNMNISGDYRAAVREKLTAAKAI